MLARFPRRFSPRPEVGQGKIPKDIPGSFVPSSNLLSLVFAKRPRRESFLAEVTAVGFSTESAGDKWN